jgi:CBS domain-containing protein
MQKPEKWLVKAGDSISSIYNKMDKEYLRFAFIVGEDQRIQNVVDYFRLMGEDGIENPDAPPPGNRLSSDFPLISATPNTFLEDLLTEGAKSKVPIVIKNQEDQVVGIIPRETLLTALTSA